MQDFEEGLVCLWLVRETFLYCCHLRNQVHKLNDYGMKPTQLAEHKLSRGQTRPERPPTWFESYLNEQLKISCMFHVAKYLAQELTISGRAAAYSVDVCES